MVVECLADHTLTEEEAADLVSLGEDHHLCKDHLSQLEVAAVVDLAVAGAQLEEEDPDLEVVEGVEALQWVIIRM